MKRSRSTAFVAVLALLVTVAGSAAQAASLQFNLTAAQTTGTVSYAGGTNPLVGTAIGIADIIGLGTSANDGITATCSNCQLSFMTGNYTGFAGDTWDFDPDGSVSIVGGVDFPDATPDITDGTTLLSGSFTTAQLHDHSIFEPGEFHLHLDAATFTDTKNSAMTDFYGLPGGQYIGGMTITFQTSTGITPETAFTSDILNSGSVVNQPVPIPAAVWLFGSGLLGLIGVTGRRKTA